ncbi:MAG: CHRD domain-containing protein [Actinomycetota bacterium]
MKLTLAVLAVAIVAVAIAAVAAAGRGGGGGDANGELTDYQEVPALSTPGHGTFKASINTAAQEIKYTETFGDTETAVTQSHIHFENRTNNGPVVVFLCSNLGNGPAGTQACPANGGTISGTIKPADVGAGAAANGLGAGEFNELVRAIKAGATYVNVHTTGRPGGEIRAQLGHKHGHAFGKDQAHK